MTTHRFYFAASPDRAARLVEECGRRKIAVAASPEDATRVIVVSALAKPDIAAAADILQTLDGAIVAAEMPLKFPFNDALLARAEEIWNRPILAIPPLQTADDAGRAMDIISAAVTESEDAKIAAHKAVAAARRALDDIL